MVLRPDAGITAQALIDWCRQCMANYKVPRSVQFVTELPLNAAGKVAKNSLQATAQVSIEAHGLCARRSLGKLAVIHHFA